jgi:hypothetical protein
MGGDLLSKKGWHVGLLVNQRKVWEAEQQTLAERKKIEQVRREREEERQMEEIARLAEENGGQKRQQRVDWMYTGATAGAAGTTEEQEAYLLGTRRVDNLLKKEDSKALEKKEAVQADPVRDIARKVMMDPLLQIEKQKQEALEKAMAAEENMARRKKRRHDRDDRESRHSKHHRERRRRSRSRDLHESHERRRSRSRDETRDRRRSRSRDENRDRRGDHRRSSHRHHSPDSRSRSPHRRHSYANRRDDTKRDGREQSYRRRTPPRSERREPPRESRGEPGNGDKNDTHIKKEDDRAAKLAAMQADASNLEADRVKRLTALEEREAAEREIEDRKRSRNPDFKSKLYRQTAEVGLADRLKGSRGLLST